MNLRELLLHENETLVSTDGQIPHNFDAKAQVGQGIEWPKAATVAQPANAERDEVEMPGDHHVVGHHDEESHGGHDGVSESVVLEDGEGGATAGSTTSADIATVSYPLLVKGKNNKEQRKNARAAVGQAYTPGPKGVGTGVYESTVGEAHTLDNNSVIYRLDREKPMSNTEVSVLGGAGRYTLDGLRQKARREAQALAKDLEIEHGGAFRRSAENVKQLTNTLNTIVAAYNELKRIRSRGGRGSRGITDEDTNFIRECLTIADQWSTKFNAQGK